MSSNVYYYNVDKAVFSLAVYVNLKNEMSL